RREFILGVRERTPGAARRATENVMFAAPSTTDEPKDERPRASNIAGSLARRAAYGVQSRTPRTKFAATSRDRDRDVRRGVRRGLRRGSAEGLARGQERGSTSTWLSSPAPRPS